MSPAIATADRYHSYIYTALRPYIGSRIWEIGCGYGQYTAMLLNDGAAVLATDIDLEMIDRLRTSNLASGALTLDRVDLTSDSDIKRAGEFNADTLVCLNVLEHIERDLESLGYLRKNAAVKTRAVFLTPAFQSLYGFMDREAGHFRRYTRNTLSRVFTDAGWRVEKSFYLNPIGGVGWFVRNRLLSSADRHLDSPGTNKEIEFFDRYCVPATRAFDTFTSSFFGQSVVVVATNR